MLNIEIVIDADNKPANLPSPDEIIQQSRRARAQRARAKTRHDDSGFPLVDESRGGSICAWVKSGHSITMSEARTQHFVTQALNDKACAAVRSPYIYLAFSYNGIGYIVMEYIDGSICEDSDARLVADAVESLISIQSPTAEPGPVGGGPIVHRFFMEWESCVTYNSVDLLEKHINGILAYMDRNERVNFQPEVEAYGLRLCPSDMNRNNFMKDRLGRIVALDFGDCCFLPPSFFNFALREGDDFTLLIARLVKHPKTTQLNAMLTASYSLVPYGRNDIAVPAELKRKVK